VVLKERGPHCFDAIFFDTYAEHYRGKEEEKEEEDDDDDGGGGGGGGGC